MNWKNWSYWLKGGVIGALVMALYFMGIVVINLLINFPLSFLSSFPHLYKIIGGLFVIALSVAYGSALGFGLGVLAGILVGYLKRTNISYMKKGALIGVLIACLTILLFLFAWLMYAITFAKDADQRGMNYFFAHLALPFYFIVCSIPASIIGAIIGAIIGWIYGKFKLKKKEENENP